jgi:PAS domain S-box-containing protein
MGKHTDGPPELPDQIAESIGDSIVVSGPDKSLLFANRSARELFSMPADADLSGLSCCDVLNMSICGEECPAGGMYANGEVRNDYFVRCHGANRIFCVSTSPLHDALGRRTGVVHSIKSMELVYDLIEEQKRTEKKLSLEQARIRALVESIADGIYSVDTDGRISHFSGSMERITGFIQEEVIGKSCREILRGNICDTDCPVKWTMKEGKSIEKCKEIIVTRDGDTVPIYISTSVLEDNGEILGVVCSVHDRTELEKLRRELYSLSPFPEIIGESKAMREVFAVIDRISDIDATTLISGETGTGKELVARAIHQRSVRNRGSFVTVNCSALSSQLLESELFGHARGSFTGAVRDSKGKFEAAHGGTLFLDEISEVAPDTQTKLLRFLQSREFERVGENDTRQVDVRVIVATNRDVKELIDEGGFREDLFYRINVIPLQIPSLRDRKGDIPLLMEHFLKKHGRINPDIEGISMRALGNLVAHSWPGNVRELENAIIYSMASCSGKRIERACLPPDIRDVPEGDCKEMLQAQGRQEGSLDEIERKRVVRALADHGWRVSAAAANLGYSRVTLWRRMKKYGIVLPNRN